MTAIVSLVVVLAVIAAAAVAAERYLLTRHVAWEWQWSLLYRDGRFVRLLDPGGHWLVRPRDRVVSLDRRKTLAVVGGQEVLTAESIGVKVSLIAEYRITDPVKLQATVADAAQQLHVALQSAVRESVGKRTLDELLAERGAVATEAKEAVAAGLSEYGMEIDEVWLRDIMLGRELRWAYAQVVSAKKEGEAALERARGESAALRNLANAAKQLKNNPDLINLRLLQAMSGAGGRPPTFVVGVPQAGEQLAARAAPPEADDA